MRLAVIGAGYVGLVTAVGMARRGHQVAVGEADPERLDLLRQGRVPFFEPDLEGELRLAIEIGSITFHGSNRTATRLAEVVFIAVPTPAAMNGEADLSAVDAVVEEIALALDGHTIVLKSTVPIGTTRRIQHWLQTARINATVVSNPEFLQAGRAMADFHTPNRIVIGSDDPVAARRVALLFEDFDAPMIVTDPVSAELVKYGSNAYLATRLSFVNELADLSAAVGADAATVLAGLGHDARIGPSFLTPGPGFGGSCLPKDSTALVRMAQLAGTGFHTVAAAIAVNAGQRLRNFERVRDLLGAPASTKRVALWGLSFKAGTDDVRESPAMWLVQDLAPLGVAFQAYDELARVDDPRVDRFGDPVEAAKDADVLVVATEWEGFRDVDLAVVRAVMRGTAVVDLRGLLDSAAVEESGLEYHDLRRVGRPSAHRVPPEEDLLSA